MMDAAAGFMSNTLNDVLSMSKIEDGSISLVIRAFTLTSLLENSMKAVRTLATAKSVRIVLRGLSSRDEMRVLTLLGDEVSNHTYTSSSLYQSPSLFICLSFSPPILFPFVFYSLSFSLSFYLSLRLSFYFSSSLSHLLTLCLSFFLCASLYFHLSLSHFFCVTLYLSFSLCYYYCHWFSSESSAACLGQFLIQCC